VLGIRSMNLVTAPYPTAFAFHLADPCRDDPRWRQVIPSSELADIRRQWPIRPTYRHAGMRYGAIVAPEGSPPTLTS
jgi:hypothetical protein